MIWQWIPHSAAVHMPLAIAVLFPVFFAAAWWTTRRGLMPERIWLGLWALSAAQVASTVLAFFSGEHAEFLSAGSQVLIEKHEALAEKFLWVWVAIFVVFTATRIPRFNKLALWTVALLIAVQLILAVQAGHAGGQLLN